MPFSDHRHQGVNKATLLSQSVEQVTVTRIISYSEARKGLKSVLDGVEVDADITIITRRNGGDAVVMFMAHYQSMAETLYLLLSPARAAVGQFVWLLVSAHR